MSLRMAAPTKHPRTGTYRVRLAVASHLQDTARRLYGRRAELIEGLGTKEALTARLLAPAAVGRLQAMLEVVRRDYGGEAVPISERDIQAMAGVFYQRRIEKFSDDPGTAEGWAFALGELSDQRDPDPESAREVTLTRDDTDPARVLLMERGLPTDTVTVERLGHAIFDARGDVARLMVRRASGDWSPDRAAGRYPSPVPVPVAAPVAVQGFTIDALLKGWALDRGKDVDAKPIDRAVYDRKRTLERLAVFVGHRDAARVSKADAVRWKEDMMSRGLHASTARNDLSECSAVWAWGMKNGKLPAVENPFAGISPPKARKKGRDRRAFTADEAAMILQAARGETGWKRWLPWVLCLTGARVGEVVQSDRGDVSIEDGIPVLRIHDQGVGRSLKNAESRREVPLHPALVGEGFLAYVAALKPGSALFPDLPADGIFGTRAATASKRMGLWLRKSLALTDAAISPAHSFRHWFIGAGRRAGIPVEAGSAMTGHSVRVNESAGYGDSLKSMHAILATHLARISCPVPPS